METTAEFRKFEINREGHGLNFKLKQKNSRCTNFSQEERFKETPLYDKGTGESCFLGPGSYDDHESFIKMNKNSCCTAMNRITALPGKESGKQCYVMYGD